jgi:hypothetical protein
MSSDNVAETANKATISIGYRHISGTGGTIESDGNVYSTTSSHVVVDEKTGLPMGTKLSEPLLLPHPR